MKLNTFILTSLLMLNGYIFSTLTEIQPEPIPKEQIEKAKKLIEGASAADIATIDVKAKYKMFCTNCHGPEGDLNFGGAKDLTKSVASLEENVAQIYFGRGFMMGFAGMLSDLEVVALAKYAETLRDE